MSAVGAFFTCPFNRLVVATYAFLGALLAALEFLP